MNEEQISYVKRELAAGKTYEEIAAALQDRRYDEGEIDRLFRAAARPEGTPPPRSLQMTVLKIAVITETLMILGLLTGGFIMYSVLVESANAAHQRGHAAASRQVVYASRAYAELYHQQEQTYQGFCDSEVMQRVLTFSDGSISSLGVECTDDEKGYQVNTSLATGGFFCVDEQNDEVDLATRPPGASCEAEPSSNAR